MSDYDGQDLDYQLVVAEIEQATAKYKMSELIKMDSETLAHMEDALWEDYKRVKKALEVVVDMERENSQVEEQSMKARYCWTCGTYVELKDWNLNQKGKQPCDACVARKEKEKEMFI